MVVSSGGGLEKSEKKFCDSAVRLTEEKEENQLHWHLTQIIKKKKSRKFL